MNIGPEYKIDPDLTDRGNPKGKNFEFVMPLAGSKIFPGDDKTLEPDKKAVRKERKIFVYVPAAYKNGTKAPLLIIHDGPGPLGLVRNALDNLTVSKDPKRKLPVFIAIGVENGGNDGKNSERGLEYDTMSDRLARFIHDEVLPAVLSDANVKAAYPKLAFTENPWGHAVMGCSSGGAAALTMGWFRPDWFRRVIAYSGTFVDQQDDDAPEEAKYPLGAWEYHSSMKLIETSEVKPLRILLWKSSAVTPAPSACASASITPAGTPFGASRPNLVSSMTSSPISPLSEGAPGRNGERFVPVEAMPSSLPALICGM